MKRKLIYIGVFCLSVFLTSNAFSDELPKQSSINEVYLWASLKDVSKDIEKINLDSRGVLTVVRRSQDQIHSRKLSAETLKRLRENIYPLQTAKIERLDRQYGCPAIPPEHQPVLWIGSLKQPDKTELPNGYMKKTLTVLLGDCRIVTDIYPLERMDFARAYAVSEVLRASAHNLVAADAEKDK